MQKNTGRKQRGMNRNGLNAAVAVVAVVVVLAVSIGAGYYIAEKYRQKEPGDLTVVDGFGRNVTVPHSPKAIVSYGPSATEAVFAAGAGSKVVAVDDYSDYPAAVNNITKIGSNLINFEKIATLAPDLIIAADIISPKDLASLEKKGYPVVVLSPKKMSDVIADIRLVGQVAGTQDVADSTALMLQGRIDSVVAKTSAQNVTRIRTYLEYYPLYTYGPGSIGDELITLAGGANIAHNATGLYPMVSNEFVIVSDPQVIVYTTAPWTTTTPETIQNRTGWSGISAVKGGKMFGVDDNTLSRPGPRIVDGLESVARILHPELFP